MKQKYCKSCKQLKKLTLYHKAKDGIDGTRNVCKACRQENGSTFYRENPENKKANHLKHNYGITLSFFKKLLKKQKAVCAICKRKERAIDSRTKRPRALAVDHNHITGKIRGLLCSCCNRALGGFDDSIFLLFRAILYLLLNR